MLLNSWRFTTKTRKKNRFSCDAYVERRFGVWRSHVPRVSSQRLEPWLTRNAVWMGCVVSDTANHSVTVLSDNCIVSYRLLSAHFLWMPNYRAPTTLDLRGWHVGMKCMVRFNEMRYKHYNGEISELNDDGTYNICFEDGDYNENVPARRIADAAWTASPGAKVVLRRTCPNAVGGVCTHNTGLLLLFSKPTGAKLTDWKCEECNSNCPDNAADVGWCPKCHYCICAECQQTIKRRNALTPVELSHAECQQTMGRNNTIAAMEPSLGIDEKERRKQLYAQRLYFSPKKIAAEASKSEVEDDKDLGLTIVHKLVLQEFPETKACAAIEGILSNTRSDEERKEILNARNVHGDTALMMAIQFDRLSVAKYLVEIGADVSVSSNHHDGISIWRSSMQVGDRCDCRDATSKAWFEGIVKRTAGNKYQIHFLGWSNAYDEWINSNSSRLCRPFSKIHNWRDRLVLDAPVEYCHDIATPSRKWVIARVHDISMMPGKEKIKLTLKCGRSITAPLYSESIALPHTHIDPQEAPKDASSKQETCDIVNGGQWTALHLIATNDPNTKLAEAVLASSTFVNGSLNVQNECGATPLICAVWANHPNVARLLLENGADPTIVLSNGLDAAGVCNARHQNKEIQGMLNQYIPLHTLCNSLGLQLLFEDGEEVGTKLRTLQTLEKERQFKRNKLEEDLAKIHETVGPSFVHCEFNGLQYSKYSGLKSPQTSPLSVDALKELEEAVANVRTQAVKHLEEELELPNVASLPGNSCKKFDALRKIKEKRKRLQKDIEHELAEIARRQKYVYIKSSLFDEIKLSTTFMKQLELQLNQSRSKLAAALRVRLGLPLCPMCVAGQKKWMVRVSKTSGDLYYSADGDSTWDEPPMITAETISELDAILEERTEKLAAMQAEWDELIRIGGEAPAALEIGDQISANYKGGFRQYPGRIRSYDSVNDRYRIDFDDGDVDDVPAFAIKLNKSWELTSKNKTLSLEFLQNIEQQIHRKKTAILRLEETVLEQAKLIQEIWATSSAAKMFRVMSLSTHKKDDAIDNVAFALSNGSSGGGALLGVDLKQTNLKTICVERVRYWKEMLRNPFDCTVCMEICRPGDSAEYLLRKCPPTCKHYTNVCKKCYADYCKQYLNDSHNVREDGIPCMQKSVCKTSILLDTMALVLTKTELTKMRYITLSVAVKKDPSSKWCSNKHCIDGIASELNGIGVCNRCSSLTCCDCGQPDHRGQTCEALRDKGLLTLKKTKGWQDCPKCKTLVEKISGCDHMDCPECKCKFCYFCGSTPWCQQTCSKRNRGQ